MAKAQVEISSADKILAETVGQGDRMQMIREMVRRRFDEAVHATRGLDQALVVLFTQGVEMGLNQKPKRTRRRKSNGAQVTDKTEEHDRKGA